MQKYILKTENKASTSRKNGKLGGRPRLGMLILSRADAFSKLNHQTIGRTEKLYIEIEQLRDIINKFQE